MKKCMEKDILAITLQYILVDDPSLLKINQVHLKHDYYTDIITFDYSTHSNIIESEIYISIDRIKENAITYKTSYTSELHRVIFHGLLHLLGYKDNTPKAKTIMKRQEDLWLAQYFQKA